MMLLMRLHHLPQPQRSRSPPKQQQQRQQQQPGGCALCWASWEELHRAAAHRKTQEAQAQAQQHLLLATAAGPPEGCLGAAAVQ